MTSRLFSDGSYCANIQRKFPFDTPNLFLDFVDSTIFEYLITNADRKVHPIYNDRLIGRPKKIMMLLDMDNGKRSVM